MTIYNYISMIIIQVILSIGLIHISKILQECDINYKSIKYYICIILFTIVNLISNIFYGIGYVKTIILLFTLILTIKILFNQEFSKCIITSFVTIIIFLISDILCSIIFVALKINTKIIMFHDILINFLLIIIALIIAHLFKKTLNKLINKIYVDSSIIIFIMLSLIIMIFMIENENKDIIIFNIIVIILLCIMIIYFINLKVKNKIVNQNTMIKDYFTNIDEVLHMYRILNDQYKNNLLIIKTMNKNKKIDKYIDSIINSNKDYDYLIEELYLIQNPEIRNTLIIKINQLFYEKANVTIDVSNKIYKVKFDTLNDIEIKKLCKIISIILDISQSSTTNDQSIDININYIENKVIMTISHNINNDLIVYNNDLKIVNDFVNSVNKFNFKVNVVNDIISYSIGIKL